jgi:predicted enzyme related to lactoylglutathione lyase
MLACHPLSAATANRVDTHPGDASRPLAYDAGHVRDRLALRARPPRKEDCMARLRHFAVVVKDLDKAAAFYQDVFELKRVGREDLEIGSAIYMSDGVINLALLNFKGSQGSKASGLMEGSDFVGAHHFGFQVDDLAAMQERIEAHGGKFFFGLGDERHGNFERKFKDPDGIIFDISENGWQGTDSYEKK